MNDELPDHWTYCGACYRAVPRRSTIEVNVGNYDPTARAVYFDRKPACARCLREHAIVVPMDHAELIAASVLTNLARAMPQEVTP
jgi:hypothetical protein